MLLHPHVTHTEFFRQIAHAHPPRALDQDNDVVPVWLRKIAQNLEIRVHFQQLVAISADFSTPDFGNFRQNGNRARYNDYGLL